MRFARRVSRGLTAAAGRDAVAVAEQILDRIPAHVWGDNVQTPADVPAQFGERHSRPALRHFFVPAPPARGEAG